MNKRFLIAGSYNSKLFWLPFIFGLIILGIAGLMKIDIRPGNYPMYFVVTLGIAALLLIITAVFLFMIKARRKWLEVGADGFSIIGSDGKRDYSDRDVISLAHFITRNFSNGKLYSVTHSLTLWLAAKSGFDTVRMEHKVKVKKPDDFSGFIARIWDPLVTRAKSFMDEGKQIVGDGWQLDHTALKTKSADGRELIMPVSDISAVDSIDGHICIWKRGEDLPCWKVSEKTVNALLFHRLLGDIIDARGEAASGGGLGRILFERKSMGLLTNVVCYVLVTIGFLIAWGLYKDLGWVSAVVAVISAVGLWLTFRSRKDVLKCHARGVFLRKWGIDRQLMYEDVGSFSYSATRMYHNGLYTGTTLVMKFIPSDPGKGRQISYSTTLRNVDDSLEMLRQHVSVVVSANMAAILAAKGAVEWTKNMRFVKDGLEVRPSGFLGRREFQKILYTDIQNFDILEGVFHIWVKGKDKSVMQEQMSELNLFPGYVLLASMFKDGKTAQVNK